MLQKEFYNAFWKCLIFFKNLICEKSRILMSLEQALEKYGSYEEIINATVRSNPGMDACTGLYDIYHGGK